MADSDEQLLERVEQVRAELWAVVNPSDDEARLHPGIVDGDDQRAFGVILGALADAARELRPGASPGVRRAEAEALIRQACEKLAAIPPWRIGDDVNAARARAEYDLGCLS